MRRRPDKRRLHMKLLNKRLIGTTIGPARFDEALESVMCDVVIKIRLKRRNATWERKTDAKH